MISSGLRPLIATISLRPEVDCATVYTCSGLAETQKAVKYLQSEL